MFQHSAPDELTSVETLPSWIVKVERVSFGSRHRRLLFARVFRRFLVRRGPATSGWGGDWVLGRASKPFFLKSDFWYFIFSRNLSINILHHLKPFLRQIPTQKDSTKTGWNVLPPHDLDRRHPLLTTKSSTTERKTCPWPERGNRKKSNIPADVEARPDLIPPSGSKLSRVLVGDAQQLDDASDWGESNPGESDDKDPAQVVQSELLEHKSNLHSWEKRKKKHQIITFSEK